jgi:hypothetical protein
MKLRSAQAISDLHTLWGHNGTNTRLLGVFISTFHVPHLPAAVKSTKIYTPTYRQSTTGGSVCTSFPGKEKNPTTEVSGAALYRERPQDRVFQHAQKEYYMAPGVIPLLLPYVQSIHTRPLGNPFVIRSVHITAAGGGVCVS